MSKSSDRVKDWRKNTKERLVKAFGGKCVVCGYDRCSAALEFHHLDPSTKKFGIGDTRSTIKKWELIVEEAEKCVMLCAICHREFHEGLIEIPHNPTELSEKFKFYKQQIKEKDYDACKICGKKKRITYSTCSVECSRKNRSKLDWDKIDLKDLYEKYSLVEIGKMLGVSDNAVRKQLLKRKLLCRG